MYHAVFYSDEKYAQRLLESLSKRVREKIVCVGGLKESGQWFYGIWDRRFVLKTNGELTSRLIKCLGDFGMRPVKKEDQFSFVNLAGGDL